MFIRAEKLLNSETSDLNIIANIYLRRNCSVKKSESKQAVESICKVVRQFALDGTLLPSRIIERITISPHKRVSLRPNFGIHWHGSVSNEMINDAIAKKENLFDQYVANTNLDQWLLLVTGHSGSSGYAVIEDCELSEDTHFAKVFLLDLGALNLFELK